MVLRNFFKYLKHPETSTILPTTPETVDQVCHMMNLDMRNVITVEYGPGIGNFTDIILKWMTADSKLAAIELNHGDAVNLSKRTDPRLTVVEGSAEKVKDVLTSIGETQADIVLSGIPLTGNFRFRIPEDEKDRILQNTYDVLKPGGIFLVYQFIKKVRLDLERFYDDIEEIPAVGKDIPRLTIFKATKR